MNCKLDFLKSKLSEEELYSLLNEYYQGAGNTFPAKNYIIDGDNIFNGWYLKAEKLVFKSGGSLWFSEKAQENRNSFFTVAKEIICEDANDPGNFIATF